MTDSPAAALARQLAARAEDACRHYLSNGTRAGRYWQVGDVHNTKGASLYVRLFGPLSGPGAAGNWTDAATAQYGDLLDLIRLRCECATLVEAMDEARGFLGLAPHAAPASLDPPPERASRSALAAAQRLFAAGRSINGTLAEVYLLSRGIRTPAAPSLRFHPDCYHRPHADDQPLRLPAMLAAVTDLGGRITGVHRSWLAAKGRGLAPLEKPRKALGMLLGNGVRFPAANPGAADRLIVGEGIETVLSVHAALPDWPAVAALSANHLAALDPPPGLRVLAIALDADEAGRQAALRVRERAEALAVTVIDLQPRLKDFNDDLRRFGLASLRRWVHGQLELV